ncbi:MAG: 30S ribosome-binding factor RbfA [Phycisphaerales bacterium]|nr:30S ribosome-binding factor RbfA [Phycisphaerales bacterium]
MRPHRKERVASVIREIVSDAIARKINDPRLAPLTTISRVDVSGDMSIATIFLTVVGDVSVERRSLAALRHATGFVRRLVADQLEVRQCPEIRFEIDETAKRIRETMQLLDENRRREPHLYEKAAATGEPGAMESDGLDIEVDEDEVLDAEKDADPTREGDE